ncbi:MAG: ABC transporter ATP-binding protein [Candidatus Kariarchaeaceae archaeon]|jgi:ABC-type lipoprotein export system ATPase subunit
MTQETTEIIVTFPVYKPFRRNNFKLRRKITKLFNSINPIRISLKTRFTPVVEELNQFIFATMETKDATYDSIEKRKAIEDQLYKLYDKSASKTLDGIKEMVNSDPEFLASYKALRDIGSKTPIDISSELDQLKGLPDLIRSSIRTLFKESLMILWDLPGDQIDRIIIGHDVINFEDTQTDQEVDIGVISDELALAALARHHVPLLCEQVGIIDSKISTLSESISKFQEGLNNFKNQKELDLTVEVASVFLGKLLGIREPISLAQKVLERYLQLENDILEEAESMGSDMVKSLYDTLVNHDEIEQAYKSCSNIISRVDENSEKIRQIYRRIEASIPSGETSSTLQEFASFVSDIYFHLEEFRFIIEVFADIPSYTSMSGGSAVDIESAEYKELHGDAIIYTEGIFKTFPLPSTTVYALRGVDLEIKMGEFVAIMGPSGSGKTTLLNILSGLETSDRGVVNVANLDLSNASERQLVKFRRDTIAFIYQAYNLLPNFTNQENVQLPYDLGSKKKLGNKRKRSAELLEQVGIGEYVKGFPLRLSGGQQQRVTIARSLMNRPDILFADEPTGDLDGITGGQVMDTIEQFHKEGVTVVLVTHDKAIAARADRIINMLDGKIVDADNIQL